MKTIPYRCDEEKHALLKSAAEAADLSIQKMLDRMVDHVLAEMESETRFRELQSEALPPKDAVRLLRRIQKRVRKARGA